MVESDSVVDGAKHTRNAKFLSLGFKSEAALVSWRFLPLSSSNLEHMPVRRYLSPAVNLTATVRLEEENCRASISNFILEGGLMSRGLLCGVERTGEAPAENGGHQRSPTFRAVSGDLFSRGFTSVY